MPIRLVVADPEPVILEGVDRLFRTLADVELVARCRRGEDVIAAVRHHRPDILILEPRLTDATGASVLARLRREKLALPVVVYSSPLDADEAITTLTHGARGIVLKGGRPQDLVECVRTVHAGGEWIDPGTYGRALDALLRREQELRGAGIRLTPRELELVRMVGAGLDTRAIAQRLAIREGTAKVHLHNIYRKLRLRGRVELMLYARARQLQ